MRIIEYIGDKAVAGKESSHEFEDVKTVIERMR